MCTHGLLLFVFLGLKPQKTAGRRKQIAWRSDTPCRSLALQFFTARLTTFARSSGATRILPVSGFLKVLPAKRWAVLIADREFVGKEWCEYLRWKGIKRCLRIEENTRIDDLLAKEQFQNLQPGEVRTLCEKA